MHNERAAGHCRLFCNRFKQFDTWGDDSNTEIQALHTSVNELCERRFGVRTFDAFLCLPATLTQGHPWLRGLCCLKEVCNELKATCGFCVIIGKILTLIMYGGAQTGSVASDPSPISAKLSALHLWGETDFLRDRFERRLYRSPTEWTPR
eukprot:TRINITY_DN17351_c0_g1_i1.p1 TRINITY_DN17351_c0_g1~~TRINITY_DN17351_c0_g1_i1.p1  ORF type:complete len:150 (+),score=7.88 TRINITY_DN17351_c0_g1_i1:291-740(+)